MSVWRRHNPRRWPRVTDDEAVLEALAYALGATTDEADATVDRLLGEHRPRYATGILEQVAATLTLIREETDPGPAG